MKISCENLCQGRLKGVKGYQEMIPQLCKQILCAAHSILEHANGSKSQTHRDLLFSWQTGILREAPSYFPISLFPVSSFPSLN